jgi:serine/threonine protein kinase
MSIPKVIGEGSYGCVHKPSLTCKNKPKLSYKNKVSKVLRKKSATDELKEYKNVNKVDKNKDFYLGKPVSCNIANTPENLDSIKKCKIGSEVLKNLEKHKLIIIGDGGINIEDYVTKIKKWTPTIALRNETELFLLESMRLFTGLIKFKENGLVHHDLKPQNIVYNEKINRLNFIDFGLMTSKEKLIEESNKNKNSLGVFHWSFPWEIEYVNKTNFIDLKSKSISYRKVIYNSLLEDFVNYLKIDKIESMHSYFYYVLNSTIDRSEYRKDRAVFLNDYKKFILDNIDIYQYDDFLEKSIDTIDSYGLGFTMMHWLLYTQKFLDNQLAQKLFMLFYQMITPNLLGRLRIEESRNQFEHILIDSGLLEKHNKEIHENIVRDHTEKKKSKINKLLNNNNEPEFIVNRDLIMSTPGKKTIQTLKSCPSGKERNPKTRRFNKKCKPGYIRNLDFKRVKE